MIRRGWALVASAALVTIGLVLVWRAMQPPARLFEGEMWVREGEAERWVLAAHDPQRPEIPGLLAGVPSYDLPVTPAAQTLLPPGLTFDALPLPVALLLQSVRQIDEAASTYELAIEGPGIALQVHAVPGARAEVAGQTLEVHAIRPWAGLLREPTGSPTAHVAVGMAGGWVEDLFLPQGSWVRVGPDLGLSLHWMEDAGGPIDIPATLEAARWGVEDGGALQWTTTFQPGVSFELRDGRTVRFVRLSRDEDGAVLTVMVDDGAESRAIAVEANTDDPGAFVHFEDMALLDLAIVIYGMSFQHATVAAYVRGALVESTTMGPGGVWTIEDRTLRIDQLEPKALPVRRTTSPLAEAIVHVGDDEIRIRQGERVIWADYALVFNRSAAPAAHALTLEVATRRGARSITLVPGESTPLDSWLLESVPGDARAGGYTVRARRYMHRPHVAWGAGMVLLGMVVAAGAIWRTRPAR